MAEKTEEQKKKEAERVAASRKKSLENLGNVLTAPGRIMESGYGAVVEGIAGFGDTLKQDALAREVRSAQFEYSRKPTPENKKRLNAAKKEYDTAKKEEKKKDKGSTPTGQGKTERFDPYKSNLPGADTPSERAKASGVTAIPNAVGVNPLDNSRWTEAFLNTTEDPYAYYYTKSSNETQVPVAFLADQSGAIYQDALGNPEELQSAVTRTIRELERAGRVNEIRDLLITSKVAIDASEINAVTRAKVDLPNSNVFGMDAVTKALIERAIKTATQWNIAAVNTGGKAKFLNFTDFLKEYKGELNTKDGSGTPSRSVTLSKTMFTPEDLEIEIDSFFQKLTGQGADQETVELLAKRLNAMSPQKTVSNTSGSTTTSVTTGGVSAADKALAMRDMALNDPNAKQFNQATTYLQYFRDALESPIKLG